MTRVLAAAAIAAGLLASVATADAGYRHRHYAGYGHVVRGPVGGPIWAGPNQCWTDEGYGRYAPCSGRR